MFSGIIVDLCDNIPYFQSDISEIKDLKCIWNILFQDLVILMQFHHIGLNGKFQNIPCVMTSSILTPPHKGTSGFSADLSFSAPIEFAVHWSQPQCCIGLWHSKWLWVSAPQDIYYMIDVNLNFVCRIYILILWNNMLFVWAQDWFCQAFVPKLSRILSSFVCSFSQTVSSIHIFLCSILVSSIC